jgi:Response regulator containing CheY-like receiver domain and AraC-type DNA-binding domain
MAEQEVLNLLPCILPFYTALICGLLLTMLSHRTDESQLERKSVRIAVWAYASTVLGWLSIIFYIGIPRLYIVFNAPVMWLFMGVSVTYYRFIWELTKTQKNEKFPVAHFLIPTLVAMVLFIWSFFVPFDAQLYLVESRGKPSADYPYYSMLFTSRPLLFSVFCFVYTVLGICRAVRFRRVVVNYSADEERSSLWWLYQILLVILASFALAVVLALFTKQQLASFPIIILPALAFMFRDIVLVHNVMLDNFVVITSDPSEQTQDQSSNGEQSESTIRENVRRLETYMRKNKPYLNPKLKITDIASALNTNRSAMSLLINRNYGMNFSRFVNRYRLDELEKLKNNADNSSLSELELIAKAGFSEWRGYLRVKERENIYKS